MRQILFDHQIDKLLDLRLRCKSAKIIQKFFIGCKDKIRKSGVVRSMIDKIANRGTNTVKKEHRMSKSAVKKATESYKTMIENEKLGDVCIVEKCFILIGTNPEEQSLMLFALKQLVELDRRVS